MPANRTRFISFLSPLKLVHTAKFPLPNSSTTRKFCMDQSEPAPGIPALV
jgi:hypothetical protein